MNSKAVQWIMWAVLMTVFGALTLAARWTDLALALTLSAAFWYGIVPAASSDDNEGAGRDVLRKR